MGPFVELSDGEEEKMEGPVTEKWDHSVPSEKKGKSKNNVRSTSVSKHIPGN